jgi:peptide methionine sulfoxide reductase msrA/msrB
MIDKYPTLTPEILAILRSKQTERPKYHPSSLKKQGRFICRGCGSALFKASDEFISGCGWPSFDHSIDNHVVQHLDADGKRQEIVCRACGGHLGHVFLGEGFTASQTRHCVNFLAIEWVPSDTVGETREAFLAGGCFWGVERDLAVLPGVLKTEVGYMGGTQRYPSYEQVCTGKTGHIETVRVVYDPTVLKDDQLFMYFFSIHDPTDAGGQGPDRGEQYQSAIFYYPDQLTLAEACIRKMEIKSLAMSTELRELAIFWPAEARHQQYYLKKYYN